MSALHEAVARAIQDAYWHDDDVPLGNLSRQHAAQVAAAVAVGVVLAEVTRSIEALPAVTSDYDGSAYAIGADDALGEALAVLMALVTPPLV